MIKRRDVVVAMVSMVVTIGAVAAVEKASPVIGSTVWEWDKLPVKKTAVGETRAIVRARTATLEELEMHATTLNPGQTSHPPHTHPNEELIIIREGTVETLSNGKWVRVGPGGVILNASGVLHGLKNVGDGPATYHVVNWSTAATPKK